MNRAMNKPSVRHRASTKRKSLLGLAVLAVLCLAFLASCTCGNGASPAPEKTPPAPPEPEEGVYLYPTQVEALPGEEFDIEITVRPSGWGVSGCEVVMTYDPQLMEPLDIEAGDFLGATPLIGLKRIDSQSGTITLAMARVGETSAPSPAGVLATVTFKVADSAAAGTYDLPLTWVGLADEDFQDITGFPVQGTSVRISS